MKKAVAYARYSSDNQREESIDAQVRSIKYFAMQYGYDIIGVYTDKAKTGKTATRENFLKMISDSARGEFEVVIVDKLDRFSRNATDMNLYEWQLNQNGVEVISVKEKLDSSPEGMLLKNVIIGINQFYSANLAREVMKGLKENAYNCIHTGGIPALGYDVGADKKYIINEREAEAVRLIFNMYRDGSGYGEIIETLNRLGFKTKRGNPFGKNSIHEILKNERYCGIYIYNRSSSKDIRGRQNRHKYKDESEIIKIPGGMPAIITEEIYREVQRRMDENKRQHGKFKAKTIYLLSGKLFCGHCGGAMTGEHRAYKGYEYNYYVCNVHKRTKQCDMQPIRAEIIEDEVVKQLNEQIFSNDNIEAICQRIYDSYDDNGGNQELLQSLADECKEIDMKIANLYKAIESGLNVEETTKRINMHTENKNKILSRILELQSVSSERKSLKEIKDTFMINTDISKLPRETLKIIIDRFVEKIFVYNDGGDDGNGKKTDNGMTVRIVINPHRIDTSDFLDFVGNALPLPKYNPTNPFVIRVCGIIYIFRIIQIFPIYVIHFIIFYSFSPVFIRIVIFLIPSISLYICLFSTIEFLL